MTASFCDWCGEPALQGKELCAKCLMAQASVDQNKIQIPKEEDPKWAQPTAGQKALYAVQLVTIIVLKAVGFTVMGIVMFVSALAGTCALLIASGSVFNPVGAAGPLFAAAVAFLITYLMWKLVNEMNKIEPRPIGPKKPISDYNFDQELEKHIAANAGAGGSAGETGGPAEESGAADSSASPADEASADDEKTTDSPEPEPGK